MVTAKPLKKDSGFDVVSLGIVHEEVVGEVVGHPFKAPRPLVRYANGAIVPMNDPDVIAARKKHFEIKETLSPEGYGGYGVAK